VSVTRSIVIPAFNEVARLSPGFDRLAPVLAQWGPDSTEVVFVDDGSTDATMATIAQIYGHLPHLKVVSQPTNLGKGAAVRLGWASAVGAHVFTMDADMAIDPRHLPEIDAALATHAFVPGNRASGGSIRYDSWFRSVAGVVFHQVVAHYTDTRLRDTQCGCKGFQLPFARLLGLFGMIDGFAYDAELFYLARRLAVAPFPATVTWEDVSGSTVSRRGSVQLLRDLRAIPRTTYQTAAVRVEQELTAADLRASAISMRQRGLVVARWPGRSIIVFPRDGGLNAVTMAKDFDGTVGVVSPEGFVGATLEAI